MGFPGYRVGHHPPIHSGMPALARGPHSEGGVVALGKSPQAVPDRGVHESRMDIRVLEINCHHLRRAWQRHQMTLLRAEFALRKVEASNGGC